MRKSHTDSILSQNFSQSHPIAHKHFLQPYLFYDKPLPHKSHQSYSNFDLLTSKRHINLNHMPEKTYKYHTKIIRDNEGALVGLLKCRSERQLEKMMGMKKRVESLEKRRNYMELGRPGDKCYRSPEQSPGYFLKRTVCRDLYGDPKVYDRRSIRQQLGEVEGIFTKMISNPSMRSLKKL